MNNVTTKSLGTRILTSAEFKNSSKVKIFPETVYIKYKNPVGVLISVIVTANTNGVYTYGVLLDVPGLWYFNWSCLGDYASSEEFDVFVTETKVR